MTLEFVEYYGSCHREMRVLSPCDMGFNCDTRWFGIGLFDAECAREMKVK